MSISTWLFHKKMFWIGDKEFFKEGVKEIPCQKCNRIFTSYIHYGSVCYIYDSLCEDCKNG